MKAHDLWKTFSLFLWFYNTSATALLLAYFYGICRLAERKFKGYTFAGLLIIFFFLMGASSLIFSLSSGIVATETAFAIWPALAGSILLIVVFRAYRLMMD